MNCRQCRKVLSAYLDAEADSHQAGAVAAHLNDCHNCTRRLAELRALRGELRALPPVATGPVTVPAMPEGAPERRRFAPVLVAAAVVVAVLAVAWLRHELFQPVPSPVQRTPHIAIAAPPTPTPSLRTQTRPAATTRHAGPPRAIRPGHAPRMAARRQEPREIVPPTGPVSADTQHVHEIVAIYEAGLALAQSGSVRAALETVARGPASGPAVENGSFSPRALAMIGDLDRATMIYEAKLTRLTATTDELPPEDARRVAECDERLRRDQPKMLALCLAEKERVQDDCANATMADPDADVGVGGSAHDLWAGPVEGG